MHFLGGSRSVGARQLVGGTHLDLRFAAEALRERGVTTAARADGAQLVDGLRQRQQIEDLRRISSLDNGDQRHVRVYLSDIGLGTNAPQAKV